MALFGVRFIPINVRKRPCDKPCLPRMVSKAVNRSLPVRNKITQVLTPMSPDQGNAWQIFLKYDLSEGP